MVFISMLLSRAFFLRVRTAWKRSLIWNKGCLCTIAYAISTYAFDARWRLHVALLRRSYAVRLLLRCEQNLQYLLTRARFDEWHGGIDAARGWNYRRFAARWHFIGKNTVNDRRDGNRFQRLVFKSDCVVKCCTSVKKVERRLVSIRYRAQVIEAPRDSYFCQVFAIYLRR